MASGWGSAKWGCAKWGSGEDPSASPTAIALISEVNIIARDLIEVVFKQLMLANAALGDISNYSVTVVDSGAVPVSVSAVLSADKITDRVFLVISPGTIGSRYDVSLGASLQSIQENSALESDTARIKMRLTKTDSILSKQPTYFDMSPTSLMRILYEAEGIEDDKIGGNQSEDE